MLHILHVFARGGVYESMGLSPDLRQLAGLVIKNYTFPHLPRLPPAVQQMLKQEMLHALTDSQPDIRNTAGILIGRISESFMIDTWADLLPPLYQMLDFKQHGQAALVDGALQVISIAGPANHTLFLFYLPTSILPSEHNVWRKFGQSITFFKIFMNGEIITHLIEKLILRTFPPLSFWHSSYTKSDLSYHNFILHVISSSF